ncbi:VPGUxxT family thioredoxin-like (seleno)protein, type 2 [Maribacter flavus]|uniref:Thioredoxin family protein n=1 Tax=Maribacter flavus TaxID=1658664 RepID=A0A5B2TRV4_9FLAO|nr:VPGUxxT family thioredoxin-like (seleno)protein, type 2 [Maribacter flavus]KAA2217401.1 thioredoxin family protein [Maribacter flavus]
MLVLTNPKDQNIELGKVTWLRDYKDALDQSGLTQKPVLLFFQEIPGCSTCVNYGRDVLSHPLMVEFIENEFVPLAIYNNRPGADQDILNLYQEPSWNNPVAHFVNENGQDIIPKLANNYHPLGMYNKLVETLTALGKPIPKYAQLLGDDLKMQYGYYKQTIYETPCFWSGETTLMQHPAIKYTEAGWINGLEVVKVFYDESIASVAELDSYAAQEGFFVIGNHQEYKIDKRPQYYLSKSPYKYLPLSKAQRARINLAIPYRRNPNGYLSPKQAGIFSEVSKGIGVAGKSKQYLEDVETSWGF